MTFEEAVIGNTEIKVHSPTLGPDMRPDFELINMKCPKGKQGHCETCDFFMGVELPDGTIMAHSSYRGICKNS